MVSFIFLLTGCLNPTVRTYNFDFVFFQWNTTQFSTDKCAVYDIGQNSSFLKFHPIHLLVISIICHVYKKKNRFPIHICFQCRQCIFYCWTIMPTHHLIQSYIVSYSIFRVSQKLLIVPNVMKILSYQSSLLDFSHRLFMT